MKDSKIKTKFQAKILNPKLYLQIKQLEK